MHTASRALYIIGILLNGTIGHCKHVVPGWKFLGGRHLQRRACVQNAPSWPDPQVRLQWQGHILQWPNPYGDCYLSTSLFDLPPTPAPTVSPPRVTTAERATSHTEWYQIVMPTGTPGSNDIHIKYKLFSNSRTLESRFNNARSSGENCTWTVTYQGTMTELTGTYYFSNGMGAGVS